MTPIIIAGIILTVGAVVLGVSWYWTKKLMDRREEGLDAMKDVLDVWAANLKDRENYLEEKWKALEAFKPEPDGVCLFNQVELRPVQVAVAQCVSYQELAQFGEIDPEGWTGAQRQIIQMHREKAIEKCLNGARDFLTVTMERDKQVPALVIHARMWCCQAPLR